MKLFSFTRMGMYNSDQTWWDYNLSLFETITLPSMSQAIHDIDDFWVLLVNKISPEKAVRRLNDMIRKSPIRGNIYILYEDYSEYWNEQHHIHSEFVKQYVEPGEYIIKHQIDSDDAVSHDMFDVARSFISEKIKEFGENRKLVFTFNKMNSFSLRKNLMRTGKGSFLTFNGFSYDSNHSNFPWIHLLLYNNARSPYYMNNKYLLFEIDSQGEKSCYVYHGSSTADVRNDVNANKRGTEKGFFEADYQILSKFGITKTAVDIFLKKFPEPLRYYESRHSIKSPFLMTLKSHKTKLREFYDLSKIALDYCDIKKEIIREKIAGLLSNSSASTWLYALTNFYEIEYKPNKYFLSIDNGLEYLKYLGESGHEYALSSKCIGGCFLMFSSPRGIEYRKDPLFCRAMFNPSNTSPDIQVWIKSIIESGESVTSITIAGLEYSMNMDGLNIVIIDGDTVTDSVNINPKENFKITR